MSTATVMRELEHAERIETDPARGTVMSMNDVRAVLSDTVRDLTAQQTTPASANAISNALGKLLGSVKLQMEYARYMGRKVPIALLEPESSTHEDAGTSA